MDQELVQVPGSGDQQGDSDCRPDTPECWTALGARQEVVSDQDQQRDEPGRAFGQDGRTRQNSEANGRGRAPDAGIERQREHRRRHQKHQDCIGHELSRHGMEQRIAEQQQHPGPGRGRRPCQPEPPIDQQTAQQSSRDGRQTQRHRVQAEAAHRKRSRPHQERRLVQQEPVQEDGRQPMSRMNHVGGRMSVDRLILRTGS